MDLTLKASGKPYSTQLKSITNFNNYLLMISNFQLQIELKNREEYNKIFKACCSKLAWFKYHSHPLICIRLAYFAIPSITRIKICRFGQNKFPSSLCIIKFQLSQNNV
jgi:hypothetical protein